MTLHGFPIVVVFGFGFGYFRTMMNSCNTLDNHYIVMGLLAAEDNHRIFEMLIQKR